jgi:hypothetical protein
MYLTFESSSGACNTKVLRSRYYAVSIERLQSLLAEAGFVEVERHNDILFQPVLTARRRAVCLAEADSCRHGPDHEPASAEAKSPDTQKI